MGDPPSNSPRCALPLVPILKQWALSPALWAGKQVTGPAVLDQARQGIRAASHHRPQNILQTLTLLAVSLDSRRDVLAASSHLEPKHRRRICRDVGHRSRLWAFTARGATREEKGLEAVDFARRAERRAER